MFANDGLLEGNLRFNNAAIGGQEEFSTAPFPVTFGADDEPVVDDEETLGPESFVCIKLALLASKGFLLTAGLLGAATWYLDTAPRSCEERHQA